MDRNLSNSASGPLTGESWERNQQNLMQFGVDIDRKIEE